MDLEAWGQEGSDPGRRGRLAIGYGAGIVVCAAAFGLLAAAGGAVASAEEEAVIDVTLAEAIPAEEPKAPEPEPPPPAAEEPSPPAAEPLKRALVAPVEIPTEAPPEADPDKAAPKVTEDGPDAYDPNGSVNGEIGGTALPSPKAAPPAVVLPPAPPPPPPPRPKGPVQLPENASAPSPVSTPQPPYPEEARTASIQATVVVKYVVTETGAVTNVVIVRGHPAFDSAVLAAVRTWRFSPAMLDGRPIPVYRTARFPFKIKT